MRKIRHILACLSAAIVFSVTPVIADNATDLLMKRQKQVKADKKSKSYTASNGPVAVLSSRLKRGDFYYVLKTKLKSFGSRKEILTGSCSRASFFRSIFRKDFSYSIHIKYSIKTPSKQIISSSEMPVIAISNVDGKCKVDLPDAYFTPSFVPGNDKINIRIIERYKEDVDSGFLKALISVSQDAAKFFGWESKLLNSLNDSSDTRKEAFDGIAEFVDENFDVNQEFSLPETIDLTRAFREISMRPTIGKRIARKNLRFQIVPEIRFSVLRDDFNISKEPAYSDLKRDWDVKVLYYNEKSESVNGYDIFKSNEMANLRSANKSTFSEKCSEAKNYLFAESGLNVFDTAFFLINSADHESSEFFKEGGFVPQLRNCLGKKFLDAFGILKPSLAGPLREADKKRTERLKTFEQIIEDIASIHKSEGSLSAIGNIWSRYLAPNSEFVDRDFIINKDKKYFSLTGGKKAEVAGSLWKALHGLRMENFGCFIPLSSTSAVSGAVAIGKIRGQKELVRMTFELDQSKLGRNQRGIDSIKYIILERVDLSDESVMSEVADHLASYGSCPFAQQIVNNEKVKISFLKHNR